MSGSWDIATATSIGSSTAKTQINGGNNLTKPTQATNLVEVVPYISSSGAYTASKPIFVEMAIESNSIDLLPKRVIVPPIPAGLGTFINIVIPVLESYECNTPLIQGTTSQFQIYGQQQLATTVNTNLACALHYSTTPPNRPEHFYNKPDDETNYTTATTTSGNAFTVNNGAWLEDLYVASVPVTPTVSESIAGYMEFSSNDFGNSMPLRVPVQPAGAGLAGTLTTPQLKLASYHNTHMPMKTSCTINTTYTNDIGQTGTGTFLGGVGYTKTSFSETY